LVGGSNASGRALQEHREVQGRERRDVQKEGAWGMEHGAPKGKEHQHESCAAHAAANVSGSGQARGDAAGAGTHSVDEGEEAIAGGHASASGTMQFLTGDATQHARVCVFVVCVCMCASVDAGMKGNPLV
jgi:hypothetical protein